MKEKSHNQRTVNKMALGFLTVTLEDKGQFLTLKR